LYIRPGAGGGWVVLRDQGLELGGGQLLMLRGHNGAGKMAPAGRPSAMAHWKPPVVRYAVPQDPAYQRQLAYMGHHRE
jgi:heme exporter protein A